MATKKRKIGRREPKGGAGAARQGARAQVMLPRAAAGDKSTGAAPRSASLSQHRARTADGTVRLETRHQVRA